MSGGAVGGRGDCSGWLLGLLRAAGGRGHRNLVELFITFIEEVRLIEKRVPVESDIDERRLHPRQDSSDASFVDAAGQGMLRLAFYVKFNKVVILQDGQPGFVL